MSAFEEYILKKKNQKEKLNFNDASKFAKQFWWKPNRDSWLNEFFGSSVIHGLKYIPKRDLSILERVFWVLAFIGSLIASGLMIGQVWDRYHKTPVVVSFNPSEKETYQLPFPAVTICNKSLFPKAKILGLFRELQTGVNREKTLDSLRLMYALCTSKQSFLQRNQLVKHDEFPELDEIKIPPSEKLVENITDFIFQYALPCNEFLRVCSWEQKRRNCSDLFKPIITDYGKCCVFNKIPNTLMKFEIDEIDGLAKREKGWSSQDINEWNKWDYEDGFIIDGFYKFPIRQRRAGNLYGLSFVVDPELNNGFCQSQDAEGVRMLLHTPIDSPRISHMGTGFGLDREIFIKVYPDLTVADQSILDYDYEDRKCIFGKGSTLGASNIDKPYTRSNCFLTCRLRLIRQRCNCTLHYAKRKKGFRICNPASTSQDYECVTRYENVLAGSLGRFCPICIYACNHLKYIVETTDATLLEPSLLWGENVTNNAEPTWAGNKFSIIHIFMGSDTNVPKLRQKLYGRVELLASIGGLLGLTMGFSVLAAIEILYLLTLRVCCKQVQKRERSKKENAIRNFVI